MAIDPIPPAPELLAFDASITHCQKRSGRAFEKLLVAFDELDNADDALAQAFERRALWLKDNPPAQGALL